MQRLFAFLLILLLMPVFLCTALLLALSDGLPVIFTQERIGRHRKPFTIYKFRTMKNGRVTLSGKLLRSTGLDELPQLINIVEGTMSFVGPRPLTTQDIDRLEWNDPSYDIRWQTTPGITGMGQLVAVCDKNVTFSNDAYYVEHRSMRLDLIVLRKSLLIPFIGKARVKQILRKTDA